MRNARRVWIGGFVLATMGAAALLVVTEQWTGRCGSSSQAGKT
jgi:hypothetical protein